MVIVSRGEWLGNPANFKGIGYCLILSRSRDNDPAHDLKWRRFTTVSQQTFKS